MTVIIGVDPHKATHTAVAIGCDESSCPKSRSEPPASRSSSCSGGRSRSRSDLGHRVGRRARLSVVSTARRCRRTRCSTCRPRWPRGCGCSARAVQQERPQRRLLGGDRRPAHPGPDRSSRRTRRGAATLGQAEPRHRAAPDQAGRVPPPRRDDQPLTGRDRQGTQRF